MRKTLFSVVLLLALLVGCKHPIFDNEYPTVNDFDVNRADIVYVDAKLPHPVRVQITGAGVVDIETGSSPQLSDSFAIDTDNIKWNDIQRGHQTITRKDAQMLFQTLVNYGLCKQRPPEETEPKPIEAPQRRAKVVANFNGRIIKRDVYLDEDLLTEVESLVKMFLRQAKTR